jgi:hypothetical protein
MENNRSLRTVVHAKSEAKSDSTVPPVIVFHPVCVPTVRTKQADATFPAKDLPTKPSYL